MNNTKFPSAELTCASPNNQIIDRQQAIGYMVKHFKEQKCRIFTNQYGIGSYFYISGRHSMDFVPHPGTFLYKCLDNDLSPTSFFAMKHGEICEPTEVEFQYTDQDRFQLSGYTHSYIAPSARTSDQVESLIDGIVIPSNYRRNVGPIKTGAFIRSFHTNFRNYYKFNEKYCDFAAGFFLDDHYNRLISQQHTSNIIGLFCMHAFDADSQQEKVRLLVFAVDEAGQLLAEQGHVILEKSWPPKIP